MVQINDVSGMAALSICESLLLALQDRNILPEREIAGILRDAAAAHHDVPQADSGTSDLHAAAADLINAILAANSLVRRC